MKKKIFSTLLALCFTLPTLSACAEKATPPSADTEFEEVLPDEDSTETQLPEQSETPDTDESAPPVTAEPEEEESPKEEATEKQEILYIACVNTGVNIRSGPSTTYSSYGTLDSDTFLAYLGRTGEWYKTYYKGKIAYVSANSKYTSLISFERTDDVTERVIEEGAKRFGVKYVYGATRLHDGKGNFNKGFTTNAFDCSSLIQYVFYEGADKLLDVTTRTQVVQGEHVKRSELKRGDCIFFTNDDRVNLTGVNRVGHVALYLGNDYILHTASDYAKIEKMSAKRWSYYIEARRFI